MSKPIYYIRDWDRHFEISQSRRRDGASRWVAIPNKHDGKSFRRLMARMDGLEILGAWLLIVQVASKCPRRGILYDDGPLDALDISIKTGGRSDILDHALAVLISPEIGWMDTINEQNAYFQGGDDNFPEPSPKTAVGAESDLVGAESQSVGAADLRTSLVGAESSLVGADNEKVGVKRDLVRLQTVQTVQTFLQKKVTPSGNGNGSEHVISKIRDEYLKIYRNVHKIDFEVTKWDQDVFRDLAKNYSTDRLPELFSWFRVFVKIPQTKYFPHTLQNFSKNINQCKLIAAESRAKREEREAMDGTATSAEDFDPSIL